MTQSGIPKTRKEAQAVGARFYRPDEPCSNGHASLRYTSTANCCQCYKDKRAQAQAAQNNAYRAAARGSRLFTYELHPDDHAAALAFCQALDIQRGRTPQAAQALGVPPAHKAPPVGPVPLPPAIAAARAVYEPGQDVVAQHEAIRERIK